MYVSVIDVGSRINAGCGGVAQTTVPLCGRNNVNFEIDRGTYQVYNRGAFLYGGNGILLHVLTLYTSPQFLHG